MAYNQEAKDNPNCEESSAYPAEPDSDYGWKALFRERLHKVFERTHVFNIGIAECHNIGRPEAIWNGGEGVAPEALCRKAAMTEDRGDMEVWGDGIRN